MNAPRKRICCASGSTRSRPSSRAAGEDVELSAEAERLGHAEALASAASAAHAALAGNPEDPEGVDATTLVGGANRALDAVRSHDPALSALADRIGEIGILLSDVAGNSPDTPTTWTPTRCGSRRSRSGGPR